jgi:RNA polymerase sigma-70 factor, ECF subfamily
LHRPPLVSFDIVKPVDPQSRRDGLLPLEQLLRRAGTRDRAAFAELYVRTAAKLFGITLRIIRQRELAEEVLQESFVTVWQRAENYDPARGSAMGWLVTIVRHSAIDQLRRSSARPESHSAPEEALLALVSPDSADSRVELGALQRCLDELEFEPRRAVLLAYCYGLSRDELAIRLAVPIGTVKSWLRRSLERLKRCLDG